MQLPERGTIYNKEMKTPVYTELAIHGPYIASHTWLIQSSRILLFNMSF